MAETASESTPTPAPTRLLSLDAYRGFVMLAMASGGLGIPALVRDDPETNVLWEKLAYQLDHVAWSGCSFWDMIQPSFIFIVGVAMPYSFESRARRGQSWTTQLRHAIVRSVVLVALGVFLASAGHKQTNFIFTNVLAQIGLGYTFVFLLLNRRPVVQAIAVALILLVYWAAFALHPLPSPSFYWSEVGVDPGWQYLRGFARHWEKNANFAASFDCWLLNRFPRPADEPFRFNPGGYTTLNFVPSMATMLLGVLAGEFLRSPRTRPAQKVTAFLLVGTVAIFVGTALDDAGLCPVVKRIWTPSWVIYSAGWACWMLGLFYWVIDVRGFRRWAFPLFVVGANSIAMYLMAQLTRGWLAGTLRTHLGPRAFSGPNGPILQAASCLLIWWLVCYWMYRRKIFVKI